MTSAITVSSQSVQRFKDPEELRAFVKKTFGLSFKELSDAESAALLGVIDDFQRLASELS